MDENVYWNEKLVSDTSEAQLIAKVYEPETEETFQTQYRVVESFQSVIYTHCDRYM